MSQSVPFPTSTSDAISSGKNTSMTMINQMSQNDELKRAMDVVSKAEDYPELYEKIQAAGEQIQVQKNSVQETNPALAITRALRDFGNTGSAGIEALPDFPGKQAFSSTAGQLLKGIGQYAGKAYNALKKMFDEDDDSNNPGGGGSGEGGSGGSVDYDGDGYPDPDEDGNGYPDTDNDGNGIPDSDENGKEGHSGGFPPASAPQSKDPLIIDIGKDGVYLLAGSEDSAKFDIDNDGFREQVGWIDQGDAFLVYDRNANGTIDDGSEFFGNDSLTGHQHLATFDQNGDGRISSADAIWTSLKLWSDANGNGISESNELSTLPGAGIASISVTGTSVGETQAGGQLVSKSGVTYADGSVTQAYSAKLTVNQALSEEVLPDNFVYDWVTFFLPELTGFGNTSDLRVAMTIDTDLRDMVIDFVQKDRSLSFDAFLADAKAILFRWYGVDDVAVGARGNIDGRIVALVEQMTGEIYPQSLNLQNGFGPGVQSYFDSFFTAFVTRLVQQSWLSNILVEAVDNPLFFIADSVMFDPLILMAGGDINEGRWVDQNFAQKVAGLAKGLSSTSPLDAAQIDELIIPFLQMQLTDIYGGYALGSEGLRQMVLDLPEADRDWFFSGYSSVSGVNIQNINDLSGQPTSEAAILMGGEASENVMLGAAALVNSGAGNDAITGSDYADAFFTGNGDDIIYGRRGNDIMIGGKGQDWLSGGGGDDMYLFNLGDGQDIIYEYKDAIGGGYGGIDTVIMGAGIHLNDVIVTQENNGNDLVLTISGSNDRITLGGTLNNPDQRIEQVKFADGSVLSHAALVTFSMADNNGANSFFGSYDDETLDGGAGNDILRARRGNDTIIGGTGNDILSGDDGDDIFVYSLGDGNDIIRDYSGLAGAGYGGNDTLQFTQTITPNDVTVSQGDNGRDIILTLVDGSTIIFDDTINNADQRIEQVYFANGTIWSHANLMEHLNLIYNPQYDNGVYM